MRPIFDTRARLRACNMRRSLLDLDTRARRRLRRASSSLAYGPSACSLRACNMRRTLLALVALALVACAPREGSPEVAYRDFTRAVSERDGERAWDLLSSDTRAWLEARAKAAAAAAPGVVAPSGQQLLLGAAAP